VEMAQAEAFLAVAEELHFGRAAERLHVSQPRVSRLIVMLERQVGAKLFDRTSRRVALTPLGEQFRDELGAAYAQMQAALDHARRAARQAAGVLRIGFTVGVQGEALTQLVAAFEAGNHGCRALLYEVETLGPYRALRAGEVDVLVNWLAVDEPDLTAGPAIDRRDRVLAVGATHPLAKRISVSVEELADYELAAIAFGPLPAALRDAFMPPHTPSGRPVRRTPVPPNLPEAVAEIARGHIAHPTMAGTQFLRRDDIVLIPIIGLPPIRLGLIWRTAHYNARIRALAATARAIYRPSARTSARLRPTTQHEIPRPSPAAP